MLLLVWFYGFTFSFIPLLDTGLSKYVPEGYLTACSFEYLDTGRDAKIFMFTYFVCAWVMPLLVIVYCYFYILRIVLTADRLQSSKEKNKTEIKLALVVFGIIGLWFLAWTPYAIVALLGITNNEHFLTPLTSMIPALFCKTSAVLNPLIYAVNHPRFRSELRRLFGYQTDQKHSDFKSSYVSKLPTVDKNSLRTKRQTSIDSELSFSSDQATGNSLKMNKIVMDSKM